MLERNKIYNIDVLEGLKQLDDESIDVIITSPPYNKAGLNGIQKRHKSHAWEQTIDYGGDKRIDCRPEQEYQEWQIEVLKECYRVLKNDGSLFYNHKNRIHKGVLVSPYQWLFKTPFIIRQEIIWNRKSSPSVNSCRFLPSTEQIYWLTKSTHPNFFRNKDAEFTAEVWDLIPEKNTKHPAPFPVKIPDNILDCIPKKDNERLLVLDPFIGSGTTAKSAIKHDCDYIGFELIKEYIDENN